MHACANGDHETADKNYMLLIIITVRSWWQVIRKKLVAPVLCGGRTSIDPNVKINPHPHFISFYSRMGKRLLLT